jgi:hypothetical protein
MWKILRLLSCWEHNGAAIKTSEWHVLATQTAGARLQRDACTQYGGAMPMMIVQLITNTKTCIEAFNHWWTWRISASCQNARVFFLVQSYTSLGQRPIWPWRKSTYSCFWHCSNDVGNYGPRLPGVGGDTPKQVRSGVGGKLPHQKRKWRGQLRATVTWNGRRHAQAGAIWSGRSIAPSEAKSLE